MFSDNFIFLDCLLDFILLLDLLNLIIFILLINFLNSVSVTKKCLK